MNVVFVGTQTESDTIVLVKYFNAESNTCQASMLRLVSFNCHVLLQNNCAAFVRSFRQQIKVTGMVG